MLRLCTKSVITIGKRNFEFVKSGSGTNIVFVPGSFSTSAAWRGIQERLLNEYQFISTSLCGYGETTESRTLSDNNIDINIKAENSSSIQLISENNNNLQKMLQSNGLNLNNFNLNNNQNKNFSDNQNKKNKEINTIDENEKLNNIGNNEPSNNHKNNLV